MTLFERLVSALRRIPPLYTFGILPYYFLRYLYHSIVTKSLWSYRYFPGHYGSTIPGANEIERSAALLFDKNVTRIDGVELNEPVQLELLTIFFKFSSAFSFPANKSQNTRYYYENPMFGFNDGFVLFCFLKHFRPKRIVEIGSGFSSALMLDVAETESMHIDFSFIEPYPDNLNHLLRKADRESIRVHEKRVQDVDLSLFKELVANDILFVDSSHVLKIGSDLSTIFFDIFPLLNPDVIVHIHDIWWPFEYPKNMIDEGRLWNESYIVRSFLQYNERFEILFFSSFLEYKHGDLIKANMPGYSDINGKSLWLRKIK